MCLISLVVRYCLNPSCCFSVDNLLHCHARWMLISPLRKASKSSDCVVQLPSRITVNNDTVSRYYNGLPKREVASLRESGQFGGWNCEMMPNVAWVRVDFAHTTSYESAMNVVMRPTGFSS